MPIQMSGPYSSYAKIAKALAFGLCVLCAITENIAQASCRQSPSDPVARKNYYKSRKYFVRGIVEDLVPNNPLPNQAVEFKIVVQDILKGDVAAKYLQVRYIWHPPFEGDRKYKKGQTYIFGIRSINEQMADIDTSNCTPSLTDAEIKSFSK